VDEKLVRARSLAAAAKKNLWPALSRDRNVVGAGFGFRSAQGQPTDVPALVIYVAKKVPPQFLPASRLLGQRFFAGRDSIDIDVLETGPIHPLAFTARERPAPSGISIGHPAITAGTLGCLVTDGLSNTFILSCNHVLANENAAAIGDAIIQPGAFDGGSSPADNIARLTQFITINPTGNTVDCAIAQVDATVAANVVDQMKNNLMPVPNPNHPAVGLVFAGGCNRTLMNPIQDVLSQLNVQFPAGPGSVATAEVGMNVEKVGRTTEYTTSTITEIDVTVTISYDFGPATFDRQIATAWMSDGGDSGSIVCQGGAGGNLNHCGCFSLSTASQLLGVDLAQDQAVEKEFRQKFLSQTLIGRFAIDTFFRNEDRLNARMRESKIEEDDRKFGRGLHDKYHDEVQSALLQPRRSQLRFNDQHVADLREGLKRAKKYMQPDEAAAADRLFELVPKALGLTPGEILDKVLNDEGLHRRVVDIVSQVSLLRQ
jgi:hypothetical protein